MSRPSHWNRKWVNDQARSDLQYYAEQEVEERNVLERKTVPRLLRRRNRHQS
jgi:hypothetical protein